MVHQNFIKKLRQQELAKVFSEAKIGFEKESMRVCNSSISQSPHPESLGSSLCNRYVTIDFSESQLELITPPMKSGIESFRALDDIHHYVSQKIQKELIWPLSMPPSFSEAEIQVGKFGSSHEGQFKSIYRSGLANRYGKSMQAISGFHFNYSLPSNVWDYAEHKDEKELKNIRSSSYLNMIRNLYKMNWLVLYLFGASPVISKNLIEDRGDPFIEIDDENVYLPYATSLRMSEFGYSNSDRKSIDISLNSLERYIEDLQWATSTIEPRYLVYENLKNSQLNPNILQIEAEYYAIARAKSSLNKNKKLSLDLNDEGVHFIEFRSLDINPFSRVGIDKETILFFEVFMIFCFLKFAKEFDKENMDEIYSNDLKVSTSGRMPDLYLNKDGKKISITDWGKLIFEELIAIANQLDEKGENYSEAIQSMRLKLYKPDSTLSGRLLDELVKNKDSYNQYGKNIAKKYKNYYKVIPPEENGLWGSLEEEALRSLDRQKVLENITEDSGITFDAFKKDFF